MKRSKHNLSHYRLFSCDMGELIPCGLTEVLPGDTVQASTSALVRFAPLVSPVMHPVHARIHHWFVPHRLVWEDFEDFITGGPDGDDASVLPTIDLLGASTADVGSLADYLGVPTGDDITVSALPFRGYALIFNEWYRDQDLVTELALDITSGADTTTSTALQQVAWERDYFTTSRPWEQKGTAVSLPLGSEAPIYGKNMDFDDVEDTSNIFNVRDQAGASGALRAVTADGTYAYGASGAQGTGELRVDLSQATSASINELREAFALQRYQEARARYGSRYTEYLRYLNVTPSDARLQRPEYLGGGKQTVQFSEVLQTAEGGSTPVGNLLGHGIGALRTNRFRRFFPEHGYVFTMMSVRPKTMYVNGLPRHWSRAVKEDFWQLELQHIGQQEVYNKEVDASHATPDGVFGYQDRYDEYRRTWSGISGEFRSTLNYWHMARELATDPALNDEFVECVPTTRNFASADDDTLYIMANHRMVARRLVSKMGNSYIY